MPVCRDLHKRTLHLLFFLSLKKLETVLDLNFHYKKASKHTHNNVFFAAMSMEDIDESYFTFMPQTTDYFQWKPVP